MVAGTGGGVHLGAGGAAGVAVGVPGQRRVVHVADRAAADEVDFLADLVVGGVVGVVGVPLGGRAEGVGDELLGAATGDAARGVVVDTVTQLVTDHVGRGDPLTGGVLADLHLGAVVVGVLVVQAHPDRPGPAVTVLTVAAQPGREHRGLLLRHVEGVDAAGFLVRAGAVAPHVVRAGERRVGRGVLAAQRGLHRVLQRVRGPGLRCVQADRAVDPAGARTGDVGDVLGGLENLARLCIDGDGEPARSLGTGADDRGLPGELGGDALVGHHDQGGALVGRHLGELPAGGCRRGIPGDRRRHVQAVDRGGLRNRGVLGGPGRVGHHHEVAALDGQSLVGALVRHVLQTGRGDDALLDEAVVGARVQVGGTGSDQRPGRVSGLGLGGCR